MRHVDAIYGEVRLDANAVDGRAVWQQVALDEVDHLGRCAGLNEGEVVDAQPAANRRRQRQPADDASAHMP
jgi:hypothetical protein